MSETPKRRAPAKGRSAAKAELELAGGAGTEFLLYRSEDGQARIEVRMVGETVWLSLAQMSELFGRDKSVISRHIRNVFQDGELARDSVVAVFATTAADGKTYQVEYFNLDVIISVGYRVHSLRGTQFRIWATQQLRDYLVKGFLLDDARFKAGGDGVYFDQLLARIRDIRSSEKVFWRKVLDIYATSVDYDPKNDLSKQFFATVQNKMHWAVHGHTAAEVIVARADAAKPNMGLTSWEGARPRRQDVEIAKNYLGSDELDALNRIVNLYLEFAEGQALRRRPMTMAQWIGKLDDFLRIMDREVLDHAGKVRHDKALAKAHAEYEKFRQVLDELPSPAEKDFEAAADLTPLVEVEKRGRKARRGAAMLPEGWRRSTLGEIARITSGGTPDRAEPSYWGGSVPWVTTGEIQFNTITDTAEKITEAGLKNSSAKLFPPGTLLMAMYGQGKTRGQVAKLGIEASTNQACAAILLRPEHSPDFYFHCLSAQYEALRGLGNAGTQQNLGAGILKEVNVLAPPFEEQLAIARIVSTWDQAIDSAAHLAANAKMAMSAMIEQSILRGVRHGAWPMRHLSDIATRVQRSEIAEPDLPVLMISSGTGFVRQDEKYSRFMAGKSVENYIVLEEGEFAYNKGNSKRYQFGCVFPLKGLSKGLVPHVYVCFRLNDDHHPGFFEHLFAADFLHDQLGALVNTGVRNNGLLNIRPADFMACKVPAPPRDEQQAIAARLAVAAEWVRRSDDHVGRLKAEKAALMADLLTGKRRVRLRTEGALLP